MEKSRICFNFLIGVNVLFGVLFLAVAIILPSHYAIPHRGILYEFLGYVFYILLAVTILSFSITIIIKCILEEAEYKLVKLELKVDDLEKKLLESQKDKQ
ncbi:hypothetical protein EDC19_0478 [Natranaerovirga hydrolytica]|uniref:Uncharacterized protein n=1 Tax=Natranaerovirga hydrolytica TaxID=680378 RepID=A0A4V2Q1L3_9FIRM|nr:hypothetical protein [Natranaerovirga hydrolytica]TCK98061.1 hypothetical protein EDC19_0478 [Natranaerovirga hydrolytica]